MSHNKTRELRTIGIALAIGLLTAIPSRAEAQCTSNADCKGGRVCENGNCAEAQKACHKDIDCPGSLVCNHGSCGPQQAGSIVPGTMGAPPQGGSGTGRRILLQARPVRESITWLWVTGIVTWSIVYVGGIAVGGALASDSDRGIIMGEMAIPVIGPFVTIGSASEGYVPALVGAGLSQLLSVTSVILGLVLKRTVQVPVYTVGSAKLQIMPALLGPKAWGLSASLSHF